MSLVIALIADALDGSLARFLHVGERIPGLAGLALDFIIDYTAYVLILAYIVAESGLISEPLASIFGVAIAGFGALYFGDRHMKTADYGFRGFPTAWTAAVYLMMVYRPNKSISVLIITGFSVLTFLLLNLVHSVRVVKLRPLTLAATFA